MAAVGNEGNDMLLTNKELQETCHHINVKHVVCKLASDLVDMPVTQVNAAFTTTFVFQVTTQTRGRKWLFFYFIHLLVIRPHKSNDKQSKNLRNESNK